MFTRHGLPAMPLSQPVLVLPLLLVIGRPMSTAANAASTIRRTNP